MQINEKQTKTISCNPPYGRVLQASFYAAVH